MSVTIATAGMPVDYQACNGGRSGLACAEPESTRTDDLHLDLARDHVQTAHPGRFEPFTDVLPGLDAVLDDFEGTIRPHEQGAARGGVGPIGHRQQRALVGAHHRDPIRLGRGQQVPTPSGPASR
jgi:hypothetical protein